MFKNLINFLKIFIITKWRITLSVPARQPAWSKGKQYIILTFFDRLRMTSTFILFYLLLISIFSLTPWLHSEAQEIQAVSSVDKTSMLIGDELKLSLKVTAPSSAKIIWPVFQDTITQNIEILSKARIDTVFSQNKKQITISQLFSVTSFDSNAVTIPPIRFIYGKINDSTPLYAETKPILIEIKLPAIDTTKAIKDIKEPLSVPLTFKEIAPWIGAAIVLATAIYFGIFYYRRRKKSEPLFKSVKPKIPAHEIALKALENLRQKKLWQNNRVKEFYTELTDIIRNYIEDRFNIRALEMTTDEIIESFKQSDISNDSKQKLKQMLELADMVKFAKEQPLPAENEQSFNHALDYIKSTIVELKADDHV